MPDINPAAPLARKLGFDIYPAPPWSGGRLGRRNARPGEMEDFLAAMVRANRAIADAGRGRVDVPCSQALPKDLADWKDTIGFVLGPFGCGKDLADVSAADFSHSAERDTDAFCRQGFGAAIAKLGEELPVQLSNPVTRIEWGGRAPIEIYTTKGRVLARAVIVTVSTGVLMNGKLRFVPDLPRRQLDAITKIPLGSYDHIALELPGNPLGLQNDETVFEKSESARTAALLANIAGSALCTVEVGGGFGRELAAMGESAMVAFALDWLTGLFGRMSKRPSNAPPPPDGTASRGFSVPFRRRCREANGLARRSPSRCGTAFSSPVRRRTKPCGGRSAAPGRPASAPRMRRCGGSASRPYQPIPAGRRCGGHNCGWHATLSAHRLFG